MRARTVLVGAMLLGGCASQVMESYVGRDITEVMMARGMPQGVIDLPDGRRAFLWQKDEVMAMPSTTTYSGQSFGSQMSGRAVTSGGGFSSWTCTYTLIGAQNPRGSYTVVEFRRPSLLCE